MKFTTEELGILKEAEMIMEKQLKAKYFEQTVTSPDDIKTFLGLHYAKHESEVFTVTFLTSQNVVIGIEDLFHGTIDGSAVHPREVVKRALHNNAAAVILSHNHPSGDPSPSGADVHITERLIDALKLIDVTVLDHIVVGRECVSFRERGMM